MHGRQAVDGPNQNRDQDRNIAVHGREGCGDHVPTDVPTKIIWRVPTRHEFHGDAGWRWGAPKTSPLRRTRVRFSTSRFWSRFWYAVVVVRGVSWCAYPPIHAHHGAHRAQRTTMRSGARSVVRWTTSGNTPG